MCPATELGNSVEIRLVIIGWGPVRPAGLTGGRPTQPTDIDVIIADTMLINH